MHLSILRLLAILKGNISGGVHMRFWIIIMTILLIAGCAGPTGQTNAKPARKLIHRESLDRNQKPFYSPSLRKRLQPR